MRFLITGGAGFIGSAVIRHLILNTEHSVMNVDKLTYAGNLDSLKMIESDARYSFVKADICDQEKMEELVFQFSPDVIMHLAAESHVDRSIEGPKEFVMTNIFGTFNLLTIALKYFKEKNSSFRFHHVSTDEVYGDLEIHEPSFVEENSYCPSSPYSATKAGSDHLVRAWGRTYGLPYVLTNCSNNYGPYQFPEKLIPLVILRALRGDSLPVYGDGKQIRDWLYVEDHAKALCLVATQGANGETYNIGGHNEMANIDVVKSICSILDELVTNKPNDLKSFSELITFVSDRPGHDRRYAINASKLHNELGFIPSETFSSGLYKTVKWYLENDQWISRALSGEYRQERLGVIS